MTRTWPSSPNLLLAATALLALYFLVDAALPYLRFEGRLMHLYEHRLNPLWLHVAFGSVVLAVGPLQLWLGHNGHTGRLHRALGYTYAGAILASVIAALQLALTTPLGLVFQVGALCLAAVWVLTTGMAILAIRRRILVQHGEWMLRSYVVTLGFVLFRLGELVLEHYQIGTPLERATVMIWMAWSVPLFLTECVLQGRHLVSRRQASAPAMRFGLEATVDQEA